jgi:hypothetical protein
MIGPIEWPSDWDATLFNDFSWPELCCPSTGRAYEVLVSAAKGGDDFAYQIVGANVDRTGRVWAEITDAWSASRVTDEPPIFFCYLRGSWDLDLTGPTG